MPGHQCTILFLFLHHADVRLLCDAEDEALYSIPAAADEMPPPQATYGEPRGPGHRGLSQIPLLATTGNDMSSKESVDMPMEAMTHPAVQKVCSCSVVVDMTEVLCGSSYAAQHHPLSLHCTAQQCPRRQADQLMRYCFAATCKVLLRGVPLH